MRLADSRKERIYLTGFMGSGKSTVGPIVANTLGYEFVDLDATIERTEEKRITDLFRERGEPYFRSRERELLAEFVKRSGLVVSLGGGTLTDPAAFQLVVTSGIMVYLKLAPEIVMKRLHDKRDRPMLWDAQGNLLPEDQLRERVLQLYAVREPLYSRADVTVVADDRHIGITVDRVIHALAPFLH